MLPPRPAIIREPQSPADPFVLALGALGWVLGDGPRAERLLALTGLDADALRAGVGDPGQMPAMLAAVLDFLSAYEPDLCAAADHLGVAPGALIAARDALT
ncbi:MAG: DUF3572 family protein [Novosphingobium sp.]